MNPLDRARRHRHAAAPSGSCAELRATLALAAPLAAANLAQTAMSVTDTVMVGRLGAAPLAAAGLGAMLYFSSGIMLQGVLSAVGPLVAHARGAGDRNAANRVCGAGLALAIIAAVPFIVVLSELDRLLVAFGYNPALGAEIGSFLRAIAWGGPAFLGCAVLRNLLAALSHTRAVMIVLCGAVAGNALLNWALIFGHLGAPALGITGSGYASAVDQWLILIGLTLCTRVLAGRAGVHPLRGVAAAGRVELAKILRLGLPIGGIMGVELGVFLATGILIGLLGAAALGAHQLALNCASTSFMVPLGLSQAATVRVAYELGAGRAAAARRAAFVALGLGTGFMGMMAVVLWTMPQAIIAVYVNPGDPANRELVHIARHLLAVAAVFQVFDGMQTIAAGALRGYRDTMTPMLLAGFGYWGAGFVGGWVLGFPLGMGAVGLWCGLALGLAVVAVLLTVRLWLVARPGHPAAEAIALR
ncbi:MAG TPA: MATE family efflux transporter [Stellaceae bacterium]|nr:MATE family efflux transporter [Stellaceae bacterium]